jgi:ParB family chromosome partitioning protein
MSDETPLRKRPTGLGRGLSSLLGEVAQEAPLSGDGRSGIQMLPSEASSLIQTAAAPLHEEALAELAESIGTRGLIQPIVVRPQEGNRYQIVAGERRWRAAQRARLHEVRSSSATSTIRRRWKSRSSKISSGRT